MTPIEIIALIVIAISIIKILVILVKPVSWAKLVKKLYVSPALAMIVCLILAAVVLYYLDAAGITIVQIFAVMAFLALVMGLTLAAYFKQAESLMQKILKSGIVKKAWLAMIVWIVLIVWALYVMFA